MFFKQILVLGTLLSLFGCDRGPNFAVLCEENPNICQEFEVDSWCKRERIAVGFANYAHLTSPHDEQKFNQLIGYENYAKCMDHASKIEHIKLKYKQTMRVNNVAKAQIRIKEISDLTKNSNHPSLLYYHWTRYLNKGALNTFLAMEGTQKLETPSLQFNLATYYAKTDQNKTLKLLYHALELTDKDEPINTEIFKSISTIFADKNKPKQAYIWSKILLMHSPDDETINKRSLAKYAKSFNLDNKFLDKVAETTLESILEGIFKAP